LSGGPTGISYYPEPSGRLRLSGLAGIAAGLLWPFTVINLGNAATACAGSPTCSVDAGMLVVASLSPICMAVTVFALERRARHTAGLGDLVGDITIGTSAVLFVLAFVTGAVGLIGSGLLLNLIGALIFGLVGYANGARARIGSLLVALGGGSQLVLLFGGVLSSVGADVETLSLLGLALYAIGWIWLGGHLLFGRALPKPQPRLKQTP
jgi:hypothetical protein